MSGMTAEWMNKVVAVLWEVTRGAWLTGAALLLVRGMFRRVLTPKAKYYLWFLLVLRLLLPVVPESSYSLMNLSAALPEVMEEVQEASEVPAVQQAPETSVSEPAQSQTQTVIQRVSEENSHHSRAGTVFSVWLAGVALMAIVYLCLYGLTAIQLHRCPDCQDEETLVRFRILKAKMGIRGSLRLAMGSGGMLGGIFRPTLVLPAEVYGAGAEPILVHELTHYRYGDRWLYLLLRVMTALHWFDPMVWLCFHLAKQDSEAACDQRVLDSGMVSVRDYLTALVDQGLLSRRKPGLMHTSFATTRKRYVRRIHEIARYAKKRPLALLLSVALTAAICIFTFTGKTEPAQPQAVIRIPSDSYNAMTEVDGKLYLVDLSGNIYTMDWYTGETEVFCKSPGGFVEWCSDQELRYLYYMDGETLCRMGTDTRKKEALCALPELVKILAVTDGCVFYWQQDGYYGLNISTMESRRMFSEEIPQLSYMPGLDNTVYVALNYSDRNDRVERWDLLTGEKTVLYEHMNNISMVSQGTVTGNTLYFQLGDCIYTMPADGSSEPKQISSTLGAKSWAAVQCSDDSLIFTVYAYGTQVKRYDPVTGLSSTLPNSEEAGVTFAAVSGNRYAIMSNYMGSGTLVIGDIS